MNHLDLGRKAYQEVGVTYGRTQRLVSVALHPLGEKHPAAVVGGTQ